MELRGTQALVTGAGGTVGSAVVRRLARAGARVRAMVRTPAEVEGADEVVEADLREPATLERALGGVDLVVHCAAALGAGWEVCEAVNLEGTRHLVEAARAAGARRLVHVSTVSVYDFSTGATIFDEDSPLWTERVDPYGFTKAEAERIVRAASDLPAAVLRPGLILSTHPKSWWGPRALERARAGEEPLVPAAELPQVHVENVAEAVLLAAAEEAATGRVYNVVDGPARAEEYLAVVYGALGRPAPDVPADAPTVRFPADRIRDELGHDPPDRWAEFLDELRRTL